MSSPMKCYGCARPSDTPSPLARSCALSSGPARRHGSRGCKEGMGRAR